MLEEMRILVVSAGYPYPPMNGHYLRTYNLFRNMPRQYSFDLLGFGELDMNIGQKELADQLGPSCINVYLMSKTTLSPLKKRGFLSRIRNIIAPDAGSIESCYSNAMKERVHELVTSGKYDLVYLCGLSMALYYDCSNGPAPAIVDVCDCISLLTQSYYQKEQNNLRKARKYLNYIWAIQYEKRHIPKLKNTVMISSVDADRIKKHCPDSRIWVVPNGVDTNYFKKDVASISSSFSLLFTGVMDYDPNNQAMLFFLDEVLPLIREKLPDVALVIAGKNPLPELQEKAGKTNGVIVTGAVADLRPYFESASLYVSPLVSGAGMKNKVLEAWAMELPVVATSISCSGLDVANGENIVIADSASDFAKAVIRVIADPALQQLLSSKGRATVEECYSWESNALMLQNVFSSVVKSQG